MSNYVSIYQNKTIEVTVIDNDPVSVQIVDTDILIKKNGITIGRTKKINFIDGDNIDISIVDIGDDIQITISSVEDAISLKWGDKWSFADNSNNFPTATYAGTLYIAADDHGVPSDADYVPANSWMISLVNGANNFSQYSIR